MTTVFSLSTEITVIFKNIWVAIPIRNLFPKLRKCQAKVGTGQGCKPLSKKYSGLHNWLERGIGVSVYV